MVKVITSCTVQPSYRLLFTSEIAMRSVSIMQVRLSFSRGFHTMRKLLSPSSPSCTTAAVSTWSAKSEHFHEAHTRLRRRIDFSFEINTADIMPVQRRAADEADGEGRETSWSASGRCGGATPVGPGRSAATDISP